MSFNDKDFAVRTVGEKPGTPGPNDLVIRFQIDKDPEQQLVEEDLNVTEVVTAVLTGLDFIEDIAEPVNVTENVTSRLEIPIIAVPEAVNVVEDITAILDTDIKESIAEPVNVIEAVTALLQTPLTIVVEPINVGEVVTALVGGDVLRAISEDVDIGEVVSFVTNIIVPSGVILDGVNIV